MDTKRFERHIEDFVCEHCDHSITGNGYTNHCPYCLWSKHVDINPGDRQETCCGAMKPIEVLTEGQKTRLVQQCEICGIKRIIDTRPEDDFNAILSISKGDL